MFGSYLGFGGGDDGDAAAGEDFESEVTAAFGPLIGLLGQDGPDKADDRGTVGEDAHGIGASADLAVETLDRYLEPLAGLVP